MLPWAFLLELASQRFHWTPTVFWTVTPRELEFALGLSLKTPPPERAQLWALMRLYPDS